MKDGVDVAVVGAGVVGAAVAWTLCQSGKSVAILEAAALPATGISARNSGVIHAGLYYPPGSVRSRTCIRGNRLLVEWAERHHVAHRVPGKLLPARTDEECAALEAIHANAQACGAEGLERLGASTVAALEPNLPPVREALLSPRSGIVDPVAFTQSLLVAAEACGALVLNRSAVQTIEAGYESFLVHTRRGPLRAGRLINAAGLGAVDIAKLVGDSHPTVYPCRGDWFRLHLPQRWKHLIYPVSAPGELGLGIHLTLDLVGGIRIGPDAEYVSSRDDFHPADGKKPEFLAAARKLLGPLPDDALSWDGCGIRPKLRAPGESQERDFLIEEGSSGAIHFFGIESPGLTASLALAEEAVARLN